MHELALSSSGGASGAPDACLHGLSLCAGAGGIDLGLTIACPGYRTVCYVERESYAAATLVARMEDKALDCAPVWDDVATFDGRPWRGTVDILLGGYPCQPFSVAGKRKGAQDPRHLWPHFARIIGECQPEWVFLENVANHLNLGYREVRCELESLGYGVTEGLFTAAEVGAPHKRQRLFVLAHAECGGRGQSARDSDPQGQPLRPPQWKEGASGSGSSDEDVVAPPAVVAPLAVADPACELHDRTGKRRPIRRAEPADECCDVANANGERRVQAERGQPQISRSDPYGCHVADTGGAGCEGRKQPGACGDERHRTQAHGSAGEFRSAFPPGPGDHEGWRDYLRHAPDAEPSVRRGADGLAYRLDQLRLCGNGVVPLVAAHAFRILSARFSDDG